MPKLEAITKAEYAGKYWRGSPDYAFAAHEAMAILVAQEATRACLAMPIAFAQSGEHFELVAVQGLHPGSNLYVAADGRWLGSYIPATYRAYPFALAQTKEGKQVLCFDRDSGLLGIQAPDNASAQGLTAFFDAEDAPSQRTRQILQFLTQVRSNREPTLKFCAALREHGLIQPWPLKVQTDAGTKEVRGLFRVDEKALRELSADALQTLNQSGALPLAYCQLLSMQHLRDLGRLAQARAQARAEALPQTPSGDLDLEFLNDGGTIKFH